MSGRDRVEIVNSDGTPLHASDRDKAYEWDTARILERVWGCQVRHFGKLCPLDYYALRDGRMVGVIEIKRRYHASGRYETVFLNFRKWLALMLASLSLARPIFVVRFDDGIFFVPVADIDPSRVTLGGEAKLVKSHSDIEPVIHVPVRVMRRIEWEASAT